MTKEIRIKLTKKEYNYLLEILKNEVDANKVDITQDVDPEGASERLEMLFRIKHAVSFLDREI